MPRLKQIRTERFYYICSCVLASKRDSESVHELAQDDTEPSMPSTKYNAISPGDEIAGLPIPVVLNSMKFSEFMLNHKLIFVQLGYCCGFLVHRHFSVLY